MARIEIPARRGVNSAEFYDTESPGRILHVALAPLHYQDGAGVLQRINMNPARIQPGDWARYPAFDGWLVSDNAYLYGLGTNGYVYFGGRRGEHYVRFRLAELGYLRTTTGAFTTISGLPDYNTANLSQVNKQAVLSGVTYTSGTTAEWRSLNTTPGGGELYLRFVAQGNRLKSEYVINQAAREWIIANRPPAFYGIPAAQAYLAFRFDVDFSDIPKKIINGALQGDTFDDSAGGVELRNAVDDLLAFMPIGAAYAGPPFERQSVALRKRFSGSTMIMGAAVASLNALPAGDLIFDPTITPNVAAGSDDGTAIDTISGFDNTSTQLAVGRYTGVYQTHSFFRFDNVALDGGETLSNAYVTVYATTTRAFTNATLIYGVDEDDATAPASYADFNGRSLTSSVAWTYPSVTAGDNSNTADIKAIISAITGRGGWATNNAIVIYIKNNSTPTDVKLPASYENATYTEPVLTIVYLAAYNQNVAGAIAPAGALVKQDKKNLAGALTPAGGVLKTALKTLQGTLGASGVLTTTKSYLRLLSGALTPAGAVLKTTQKNLAGALASSGALNRYVAYVRALAGSVAPIGDVTKNALKTLQGALNPSAALSTLKSYLVVVSGALATSGDVLRGVGKNLSGSLTPAGALVKDTLKNLAGSLTPVSALSAIHGFFVSIGGALAPAAALVKGTGKSLGGALAPAGNAVKGIFKGLAGALGLGGALSKTYSGATPEEVIYAVLTPPGIGYYKTEEAPGDLAAPAYGWLLTPPGVGFVKMPEDLDYMEIPLP